MRNSKQSLNREEFAGWVWIRTRLKLPALAVMAILLHASSAHASMFKGETLDKAADILAYGMAEETIIDIAGHLKADKPVSDIAGICYIASQPRPDYLLLPPHAVAAKDKAAFADMFARFAENADPGSGQGLCQQQDTRFLIVNPPRPPIDGPELDRIHELGFHRDAHPIHQTQGHVRALDTLRFSIITHRGCFGDCAFCAIAVHEGRHITDRSEASILREASALAKHADFKDRKSVV